MQVVWERCPCEWGQGRDSGRNQTFLWILGDSKHIWGPGKAILSIAHFLFIVCNRLSILCEYECEVCACVCVRVWICIKGEQSVIFQHRVSIFNKKVKSWLNYSEAILGAKICIGHQRYNQIICLLNSFTIKYILRMKYIWAFLVFVRKMNFQRLKNCPEVNTKNNFQSLRASQVNGSARTK